MIYFILLCIAIGMSLFFRKSKVLLLCIFALMYVIALYSGQGNDLSNLNDSFDLDRVGNEATDRSLVFYTVMYFFNDAGYSFEEFRIIHFIIINLMVFLLTSSLTKDCTFVIACCAFFPLLTFCSQMRNGLGAALLYLAFFFLFSVNHKGVKTTLFLLLIILASTIHYLFCIYVIALIPLSKWNTRKVFRRSIFILVVLLVLIFAGRISFVYAILGDWYSQYFTSIEFSLTLHIPLISLICMNTYFTYLCEEYVVHKPFFSNKEKDIVSYISRMNISFLSLLPLLFMSGSFFRIYQNLFLLSAVAITITASRYYVKGQQQGLYLRALYLIYYLSLTIFYNHWQGEFLTTIRSISL